MRTLFVLLFVAGAAAGFVYPWYVTNFSGHEIGSWPVYRRGGDFEPVTARLAAGDAPVRVLVDMTAVALPEFAQSGTALTITASTQNRTVLAEMLSFHEAKPQEKSPQLREKIYRDEAGVIDAVEDGDYTFTVGRGDLERIEIRAVDLVLRGGAGGIDPRAQPVGYSLVAMGLIGFVLASRRKRERNPNSQPPPPRWGRGADPDK